MIKLMAVERVPFHGVHDLARVDRQVVLQRLDTSVAADLFQDEQVHSLLVQERQAATPQRMEAEPVLVDAELLGI